LLKEVGMITHQATILLKEVHKSNDVACLMQEQWMQPKLVTSSLNNTAAALLITCFRPTANSEIAV
jgi:hypothetical protein